MGYDDLNRRWRDRYYDNDSYDLDGWAEGDRDLAPYRPRVAPGKVTLTSRLPLGPPRPQTYPTDAQAVATRGVAGSGGPLPHGERIQAAFGRHALGGVRAHIGGAAAEAASDLGAIAFATGNRVAFADSPDLHTAAHEAAHVVQQRAGVQLLGGVGQAGDVYEQHADQVADAVVRGDSAEPLLDRYADRGHGAAVQLREASPASEETDEGGGAHVARVREWVEGRRDRADSVLRGYMTAARAGVSMYQAFVGQVAARNLGNPGGVAQDIMVGAGSNALAWLAGAKTKSNPASFAIGTLIGTGYALMLHSIEKDELAVARNVQTTAEDLAGIGLDDLFTLLHDAGWAYGDTREHIGQVLAAVELHEQESPGSTRLSDTGTRYVRAKARPVDQFLARAASQIGDYQLELRETMSRMQERLDDYAARIRGKHRADAAASGKIVDGHFQLPSTHRATGEQQDAMATDGTHRSSAAIWELQFSNYEHRLIEVLRGGARALASGINPRYFEDWLVIFRSGQEYRLDADTQSRWETRGRALQVNILEAIRQWTANYQRVYGRIDPQRPRGLVNNYDRLFTGRVNPVTGQRIPNVVELL